MTQFSEEDKNKMLKSICMRLIRINQWSEEDANAYIQTLREFPDLDERTLLFLKENSTTIHVYNLDEFQKLKNNLNERAEKLEPFRKILIKNGWKEKKVTDHINFLLAFFNDDDLHVDTKYLEEHGQVIYAPNLDDAQKAKELIKTPTGEKLTIKLQTQLYKINDLFIQLKIYKTTTEELLAEILREFKDQAKTTKLNEEEFNKFIMDFVKEFIKEKYELSRETIQDFLSKRDIDRSTLKLFEKIFTTEVMLEKISKLINHLEYFISPLIQALNEKTGQLTLTYEGLSLLHRKVFGEVLAADMLMPILIEMLIIISNINIEYAALIMQLEFDKLEEELKLYQDQNQNGLAIYLLSTLNIAVTCLVSEKFKFDLTEIIEKLESLSVEKYESLKSSKDRYQFFKDMTSNVIECRELFLRLLDGDEGKNTNKEHIENTLYILLIKVKDIVSVEMRRNLVDFVISLHLSNFLLEVRNAFKSLKPIDDYRIDSILTQLESERLRFAKMGYESSYHKEPDSGVLVRAYTQAIIDELNDGLKFMTLSYDDIQSRLGILERLSQKPADKRLAEVDQNLLVFRNQVQTSQDQVKKFENLYKKTEKELEELLIKETEQFEKNLSKSLQILMSSKKSGIVSKNIRFSIDNIDFDSGARIEKFSYLTEKLIDEIRRININLFCEADRNTVEQKILAFRDHCEQQKQEFIKSCASITLKTALEKIQELKSPSLREEIKQKANNCMDKLKVLANEEGKFIIEILKENLNNSTNNFDEGLSAFWSSTPPKFDFQYYSGTETGLSSFSPCLFTTQSSKPIAKKQSDELSQEVHSDDDERKTPAL